jgi:hypothetical protein
VTPGKRREDGQEDFPEFFFLKLGSRADERGSPEKIAEPLRRF